MTDNKLTDSEVVKALEICSNNGDCKECPINPHHGNYGYCTSLAIKAALDLINRLQTEIEHIDNESSALLADIDFRENEINRLQEKVDRLNNELTEQKLKKIMLYETAKEIEIKAYKKFAERLCEGRVSNDNTVILAKCLLKELVGE